MKTGLLKRYFHREDLLVYLSSMSRVERFVRQALDRTNKRPEFRGDESS